MFPSRITVIIIIIIFIIRRDKWKLNLSTNCVRATCKRFHIITATWLGYTQLAIFQFCSLSLFQPLFRSVIVDDKIIVNCDMILCCDACTIYNISMFNITTLINWTNCWNHNRKSSMNMFVFNVKHVCAMCYLLFVLDISWSNNNQFHECDLVQIKPTIISIANSNIRLPSISSLKQGFFFIFEYYYVLAVFIPFWIKHCNQILYAN